ncbi:hypothetical protein TWF696_001469 [Orbilia brochopaga]|uniref:Myb-like domain-containing protein n=1 Tax=Orbilia brochopaga TaxID=3140254 RepID=A0AAV9UAF9_9PEZI
MSSFPPPDDFFDMPIGNYCLCFETGGPGPCGPGCVNMGGQQMIQTTYDASQMPFLQQQLPHQYQQPGYQIQQGAPWPPPGPLNFQQDASLTPPGPPNFQPHQIMAPPPQPQQAIAPPPQPSTSQASTSQVTRYPYGDEVVASFVFVDRTRPRTTLIRRAQRGTERGWSAAEDNFLIAFKESQGIGAPGKDWTTCAEELDNYTRESFPEIARKRGYKSLSTVRDHWKHVRNGQTPATCLVNTYLTSTVYNSAEWARERQWIQQNHFA